MQNVGMRQFSAAASQSVKDKFEVAYQARMANL